MRLLTLCFDVQESGSSNDNCQKQGNDDAHVYVSTLIYIRRGLRRCSFRQLGDARASERGTSDNTDPHAFLCVLFNKMFLPVWGRRRKDECYYEVG